MKENQIDKQAVEEMMKVLEHSCDDICISNCDRCKANLLYNKGYRKQSEVIDEFVSRLKERLYTIPTVYNSHFGRMIDDVAKDMKGDKDTDDANKVSSGDICVVCGEHVPEGRQICSMCETGQRFMNKRKGDDVG